MRHHLFATFASALALLCIAVPCGAQNESQDEQIAKKLIGQVLGIKHGDVVVIVANPTSVNLSEDIATEATAVGAFPIISMGSNRMNRLYYERVPARFDSEQPKAVLELARIADEIISIDLPADPSVIAGVPASRIAAVTSAGNAFTDYVLKRGVPVVTVGNGLLPSGPTAKQFGVGEDVLATLFWTGMNADYAQLHRDTTAVSKIAAGAHAVHITAPNGTDFTFATRAPAAQINDGVVSAADRTHGGTAVEKQLPAGDVFFLPQPGSANGTVVFGSARYNGTLVSGMKVRFAAGKVVAMSAASGISAVQKQYVAGGTGRDEFSFVDFGTNRSMHVPSAGEWGYGPSMAAGYVSAGFGFNANFGGSDRSPFFFGSNIPEATVTVDGKRLISAGSLVTTL